MKTNEKNNALIILILMHIKSFSVLMQMQIKV